MNVIARENVKTDTIYFSDRKTATCDCFRFLRPFLGLTEHASVCTGLSTGVFMASYQLEGTME